MNEPLKGGESMIKPGALATIEDLEFSLIHLAHAADLGEIEAIKKTVHELQWMVEEIKEAGEVRG